MSDIDKILERVDEALSEGKVWRAKEILRGNIGNRGYSPRLYEKYGELLLETGEQLEAGKYLLLSAKRKEEYKEAISLFLKRYSKASARRIVMSFPRGARLKKASHYPEPLKSDLKKLGIRWRLPKANEKPLERGGGEASLLTKLGCFAILAIIMILAIIGLSTVTAWLS